MTRSPSSRFVAGIVLTVAALGAATAAQARADVFFSIDLPIRSVYVEPQQVYVQPQPVYVQPRPVYVQPQPVYVQPQPVYVQPPAYVYERPWRPSYEAGFERENGWQRAEWQRREWKHRHHHHQWNDYRSQGRDQD